jgi:hypothetical protein
MEKIIEKNLEAGGLIVSARVGHVNQVLPIVRYWIPHIHIISPEGLQEEMEKELKGVSGAGISKVNRGYILFMGIDLDNRPLFLFIRSCPGVLIAQPAYSHTLQTRLD